MTLALRYAVRTDVGLLREGNEDSAYAGPNLLAIADGMGGHAAGEVASSVAISALAGLDTELPQDQMLDSLAAAVAQANNKLHEMSVEDPSVEGMGTTLTALLWSKGTIAICHIGDSRAYLLRDGDFHQITRDHTLVQSLVDDGRLSPAQAATHPQRSLVMRALQSGTEAEPDLSLIEAKAGDRYLLCSDGLSDVVSDDTLRRTLLEEPDREDVVLRLTDLAIRGGGPDNITCIVADVVNSEADSPAGQVSMVVGAASNSDGRPRLRTDSPAGRAHLLTRAGAPAGGVTAITRPAGAAADGQAARAEPEARRGVPRRRSPGAAAALAGGHDDPDRPVDRHRRRRIRRVALHAEPVLRRHRRQAGDHLPRGQPEGARDEPVQRVLQDRHPAVPGPRERQTRGRERDSPGQPDRRPEDREQHPADHHLQHLRRRLRQMGGPAHDAQGHGDGPWQEGSAHRARDAPCRAQDAQGLRAAGDGRVTAISSQPAARPSAGVAVAMPRGRRRTELLMLAFAVGVVLFAYANVGFGLNGKLPAGLAEYGLAFAAIVLVAHLAVRRLAPFADPLLLPLAALLNGLGIVMIYRLQESGRSGNPGNQISTISPSTTTSQVLYSALGVAAFIAVLFFIREVRVLQRYTYTLGVIGLILLAIPAMLPDSMSEIPGTGAKIQIAVGGFTIQPEQFAELALAVFFAGYLVAKRDVLALAGRRFLGIDLPRARDLGPVLIAWGASLLLLVFESDIGTSALFFGMFVAMLYIATQRTSWLLIGILLFVFGAYVASKLFSHVGARFTEWLHPFTSANVFCNPTPAAHCVSSYQLVQGLYGMGFGGILGTGLGHGQPYFTPLVQSDFIMTAFGEELGLTGLMAMLLIFGLMVQRGLRAAVAVRDPFSKLLAGGLAFAIALQVFIIVGGVTRLIPLTGITTPFLSQGGSSLLTTWALVALLMRVSDTARQPAPQPIQDEGMTQVVRAG